MAGGNLVDCSVAVTTQTGDSTVVNSVSDDCTMGSQQSKTGKIMVSVNLMMALYALYTIHVINQLREICECHDFASCSSHNVCLYRRES